MSEVTGRPRRCAVLGSPISHSLSPVLHRRGYRELGLDWRYDAYEVREPDLADFLAGLDSSWRGLSLTMPLKRAVLPLADEVSRTVEQVGAANTLLVEDGRSRAENTDIPGLVAATTERVAAPVVSAVVLGGGATAASALFALADLGCEEVTVVVRDAARAADTLAAARRHPHAPDLQLVGFDAPPQVCDLLVSTIPADVQSSLALPHAEQAAAVFDVLYHPWPTPLAHFARTEGRELVTGLDLLAHQAAEQLRLMTGLTAPLHSMREAGLEALEAR